MQCFFEHFIVFCWVFLQNTNDPSNVEALEYLHQIEPLAEEIEQAKMLYKNRDFQGAIILLSKAIDVSKQSNPHNFCLLSILQKKP